ncbi:MAG: hypothetical protein AMXMBFR83_01350, partial [Phycisphaerae bacterium]
TNRSFRLRSYHGGISDIALAAVLFGGFAARELAAKDAAPPKATAKPVYNDLPARSRDATGLIVIVHGWNSSPHWWPDGENGKGTDPEKGLKSKITAQLKAAGEDQKWDIVAYDWADIKADGKQYGARTGSAGLSLEKNLALADQARANGMAIGTFLGGKFHAQGYEKIHFIAHSAGGWLTDRAADRLKALKSAAQVQQTFLDAFMPLKDANDDLGDSARFAVQYVDAREYVKDKPFTNATLKHAYNLDVTALDPRQNKPFVAPFSDDPDTSAHAWPHEWYRKTTDQPGAMLAAGWGYNRSMENKMMPAYGEVIDGRKVEAGVRHGLTAPPKPPAMAPPRAKPPIDFRGAEQSPGGVNVEPATGLSFSLSAQAGVPDGDAWLVQHLMVDEPANLLHFDYDFEGSGQGLLSVYLDDLRLFSMDERYARNDLPGPDGEYRLLGELLPPGSHRLAFRLDAFSDDPLYSLNSSLAVSNVWLGYAAVPEPAGLILLAAGAGTLVRRRRGDRTASPALPDAGVFFTH